MTAKLNDIVKTANAWLLERPIKDFCPNGLQVEGKAEVRKIVTGVTAGQELLNRAVDAGADLILVHHGYFWRGENERVVGMKKRRLQTLLKNDISLLAYHLPLDIHPEFGNNVELARVLNFTVTGPLEPESNQSVGLVGKTDSEYKPEDLSAHIEQKLGRSPLHIAGTDRPIQKVAWSTGAAQSYIEKAIDAGVDAFISGEISEPTVHIAREAGIHYFAAGHHATERYGVKALGERLAAEFKLELEFIDVDNPV